MTKQEESNLVEHICPTCGNKSWCRKDFFIPCQLCIHNINGEKVEW